MVLGDKHGLGASAEEDVGVGVVLVDLRDAPLDRQRTRGLIGVGDGGAERERLAGNGAGID